ncbi:four helix bundle protein [Adhaeribacter aerolatus]|uniref:Four helix bundle protein n=1 Tax=Adhaeribacter aerolatus TaxID=670289 RepID=A0A512B3M8_9BACT|nr:four helix bundle protein [Adhaeribacter aerolatus]GEO06566.1 four helix bundle protein [Adhaeribacter aerolatus]
MKNFKDLLIWQRSHQLTLNIYKTSASFPAEKKFGLTSQIRRASASIPTNIAEGSGRQSYAEFHRFLTIAMGSASELEYQLLLSKDLSYLSDSSFSLLNNELMEIKKMLNSYIQKVKSSC